MTTMNVLDATGQTVAVEKPLTPGRAADASSRPVALSTEDVALLGALTETAPATDTASSGQNGRLQRIAQRLTSLIALLPAALGGGGGLKIDGSGTALPVSAASLPLPTGAATEATLAAALTTADFDTKAGSLTETAPATDTASSGLNGRLQRIAQRLTSLIALLPSALGTGGGLKVDGSGTALPVSGSGNFASTVADGANVTIGAKADAKSTATDTTAITAMSVWKQISASVQALVTGTAAALGQTTKSASVPVTVASDDDLQGKLGALTETAPATDTASSGLNGRLQRVAQRLTSLIALVPSALTGSGNFKVALQEMTYGSGVIAATTPRMTLASDSPGVVTLGQTTKSASVPTTIASDQGGLSNRAISAAFSTLTRPANTTAYSAGDSISDNGTAGSVTALSATPGDVNDDPLFISELLISSTDTGLAGKRLRAYVFNADPTASSGVGGGDNAAYSQKKAGYIGSFSGVLESGFSDGTVGRLVPTFADGAAAGTPHASANGFIVTKPTAGAKTLYIQFQAVDGFTPSANSTTIIATARGWQARAA